ncbi:hypothetical protein C8Q70DRAFT_925541 [Cubamyces menziesii]|nr:hypothetical protein C8Q70DRAFT_925541 [Cubamyces menziesii]
MGLERHSVLFDKLSPQNMSGDETDGPSRKLPMAYRIIEASWQSDALKTFFRALDVKYRRDWEKPKGLQRAKGGNAPRTRITRADGRIEVGYAPCGLWRNCYNEEWLRSLASYQKRALQIVNSDYDFDLTTEDDDGTDSGSGEEDIPMEENEDADSADEVEGEL